MLAVYVFHSTFEGAVFEVDLPVRDHIVGFASSLQ
jgi:hypothetical protein